MLEEKYTGRVVWFNDKRGYGFCSRDDGGKDLFCHYTNIISEPGEFKTLAAGTKVEFTIGANDNGPQAEDIVVLEEPPETHE